MLNNNEIIEPILIESDHDDSPLSGSSSDEDFIVSSNEESSSSIDDQNINNRDLEILTSRPKTTQQLTSKPIKSLVSHPVPIVQTATNLTSLSKLLLLNGSSIPSFAHSPFNPNKSPLISIQPKPTSGTNIYQVIRSISLFIYLFCYSLDV